MVDPGEENTGEVEEQVELESHKRKKSEKVSPKDKKQAKILRYQQASADLLSGKFRNISQAAKAYNVSYQTLWEGMVKRGEEFHGSGKFTTRLSL